jgi:hypothetical protein
VVYLLAFQTVKDFYLELCGVLRLGEIKL